MRKPYGHYDGVHLEDSEFHERVRTVGKMTGEHPVVILDCSKASNLLYTALTAETVQPVMCVIVVVPELGESFGTGIIPTVTRVQADQILAKLPANVSYIIVASSHVQAGRGTPPPAWLRAYTGTVNELESEDALLVCDILDTLETQRGVAQPALWAVGHNIRHKAVSAIAAARQCWLETV